MRRPGRSNAPHLVLVGGGHTHVQVLRHLIMNPEEQLNLTVVVDVPVAVYSGMVPGFVAGQYQAHELEIDVVPLARRAGARVILSAATGIDPAAKTISLTGRPPIRYDVASFDIGSTVAGLDLPGIREHTLPTRPISRLIATIPDLLERARTWSGPFRLVVVGAGAGGIEMAFTLRHRLLIETNRRVETTLLQAGTEILPGYGESLRKRILTAAKRSEIEVITGMRANGAKELHPNQKTLLLENGDELVCDACVWVVGATAHSLFADSGVATDSRGFARIRSTLQLLEHDDVFAVGDCATLEESPDTPKAGVYAVRQGPFLIENLLTYLDPARGSLESYKPQKDFLSLLNLGDGGAVGAKWGFSFEGGWVMRLKDRIDRRFMQRFQTLDANGRELETSELAMDDDNTAASDDEPMFCGGCAAKVGATALDRVLDRLETNSKRDLHGLAERDDAAAWQTPSGEVVLTSVDFFRAFTDDPHLVGRVAAVNACSDIWAKAVPARHAQAIVTVREGQSETATEDELYQVMTGIRSVLDKHDIELLGGHSVTGPELQVGLTVDGIVEPGTTPLSLAGALPGQSLVLTKALGTGVVMHADMMGRCTGRWLSHCLRAMLIDNRQAARLAVEAGASAMTDVTGFGLGGHLIELLEASKLRVSLDLDQLPALPGALELLAAGERSTFHEQNAVLRHRLQLRMAVGPSELEIEGSAPPVMTGVSGSATRQELLFDPQTSGGLLIVLAPEQAESLVAKLRSAGYDGAAVIGQTHAQ